MKKKFNIIYIVVIVIIVIVLNSFYKIPDKNQNECIKSNEIIVNSTSINDIISKY